MTLDNWNDYQWEAFAPNVKRKVLHGPTYTVVLFSFEKGANPTPHSHPHDQLSTVQSGKAIFTVGDTAHEVGPGDVLRIPGGVPHGVEVIEGPVSLLDVFVPVREDFPASKKIGE